MGSGGVQWDSGDVVGAARLNQKSVFVGTGAQIKSATTYAGMLAYCTSTGSGFTADFLYERNTANSAWSNIPILTSLTANKYLYYDGSVFTQKFGPYEILDNHTAGGTESTYTFTPGSALTAANYTKVIITIEGEISAALALYLTINGASTGYMYNGARMTGAAVTAVGASSQAQWVVLSNTTLSAAGDTFSCTIEFDLGDTTSSKIGGFSKGGDHITNGYLEEYNLSGTAGPTITSITVATSTSTWKASTRITTTAVRRSI